MNDPNTDRAQYSECAKDGHDWRLVSNPESQGDTPDIGIASRRDVYRCIHCAATKVVVTRED
jgi:hypothetical protein